MGRGTKRGGADIAAEVVWTVRAQGSERNIQKYCKKGGGEPLGRRSFLGRGHASDSNFTLELLMQLYSPKKKKKRERTFLGETRNPRKSESLIREKGKITV